MIGRSQRKAEGEGAGDWVAIGEVVGVFGVRGELKVQPLTDFPERFARTDTVYAGDQHRPFRVRGAHPHKRLILLKLDGVDDANAAERLRGARLWIPLEQITPLAADQFYLHDVIGLRVRHVNGQPLGRVADVITAGSQDLFVVRETPDGRERLLPAVKAFVKAVDVAGGEVVVDPIPGLFDDQGAEAGATESAESLQDADGADDGEDDGEDAGEKEAGANT